MPSRLEVYAAIDSERDYQDSKWGDTLSSGRKPEGEQSGGERSIDEFILYIAGYTNDLVHVASHFGDAKAKLEVARKIGALVVALGEQHGLPYREEPRG